MVGQPLCRGLSVCRDGHWRPVWYQAAPVWTEGALCSSRSADSIRADSSSIFRFDRVRNTLACTLDSSAADMA